MRTLVDSLHRQECKGRNRVMVNHVYFTIERSLKPQTFKQGHLDHCDSILPTSFGYLGEGFHTFLSYTSFHARVDTVIPTQASLRHAPPWPGLKATVRDQCREEVIKRQSLTQCCWCITNLGDLKDKKALRRHHQDGRDLGQWQFISKYRSWAPVDVCLPNTAWKCKTT